MSSILKKYASLLVNYCLELKAGEKLLVKTTFLAEPLVREVFREALKVGASVEHIFEFREQHKIFLEEAQEGQLKHISPSYKVAMETYDAYLHIRAPYTLGTITAASHAEKSRVRNASLKPIVDKYFKRTGSGEMKRTLCQFPTIASAQLAGMSLEDYEHFVYDACKLYDEHPASSWLKVRAQQQQIVDEISQYDTFRYLNDTTDITFSTKGRTWINSDGRANMPSGEVYTSPVEDSVNGHIHFSYPSIYQGKELEDVRLWVEEGYIVKWDARTGKDILDYVFGIEGTRRFGEAAIGTNYKINKLTKNILFDEKIGGAIHMAIGQSYHQAGGKNNSVVHWDMITDMTNGGKIMANDEMIYNDGRFLFLN
ncbi:MAG: aminopeptidase [Bacteroidota bacterium]